MFTQDETLAVSSYAAIAVRTAEVFAQEDERRRQWLDAALRQRRAWKDARRGDPAPLRRPLAHEKFCLDCGLSHAQEDRLRRLSKLLPCTASEVYDALPCLYPRPPSNRNGAGQKRLYRDLQALGAIRDRGLWMLPEVRAA